MSDAWWHYTWIDAAIQLYDNHVIQNILMKEEKHPQFMKLLPNKKDVLHCLEHNWPSPRDYDLT